MELTLSSSELTFTKSLRLHGEATATGPSDTGKPEPAIPSPTTIFFRPPPPPPQATIFSHLESSWLTPVVRARGGTWSRSRLRDTGNGNTTPRDIEDGGGSGQSVPAGWSRHGETLTLPFRANAADAQIFCHPIYRVTNPQTSANRRSLSSHVTTAILENISIIARHNNTLGS